MTPGTSYERNHMTTLTTLTAATGRTVRPGLAMDDPCPVSTGLPVAQGDVLCLFRPAVKAEAWASVPARGQVLVAGIHDHVLFADPDSGVRWAPHRADELDVAVVDVPSGAVAWLLHTDEHGAQGLGAGRWVIRCQQEWTAAGHRRVSD